MSGSYRRLTRSVRLLAAAAVLFALAGLPQAQAQLNFNQLLRPMPAARVDANARRAQMEADRAGQDAFCSKAMAWLADNSAQPPGADARRATDGGTQRSPMPPSRSPLSDRSSRRASGDAGPGSPANVPRDAWLLEDSRFIPYFGKAYDQLSDDELTRYGQMARSCRAAPRTAGTMPVDISVFGRVFMPRLFPMLSKGVQALRAGRQEAQAAISQLDALAPGAGGLEGYQQLVADAPRLRSFLSAQDAEAFDRAMKGANERVARPAMANLAQQTIASAQGYEGLVAVNKLLREMQPTDRRANASADAATLQQLTARQSALAGGLAREEKARLGALGAGVVGLERGVAWAKDFNASYGKLADVPEIADVWRDFLKRRNELIDASRPELSRRIGQTRDVNELQALMAKYLPLESDQRTEGGTALATRAAEQRDAFDKRRILGDSAVAAAPASDGSSKGGHAPAKAVPAAEPLAKGEPSESEMYDLVKQQFDNQAAKVRRMAEMCKNGSMNNKNDPAAGLLCLTGMFGSAAGGAEAMKITSFEKLGCERASGKPGYVCDYLVSMSGGAMRAMGPSMTAMFGDGNAAQARFLKTKSGWMVYFGEKN